MSKQDGGHFFGFGIGWRCGQDREDERHAKGMFPPTLLVPVTCSRSLHFSKCVFQPPLSLPAGRGMLLVALNDTVLSVAPRRISVLRADGNAICSCPTSFGGGRRWCPMPEYWLADPGFSLFPLSAAVYSTRLYSYSSRY